MKVFGASRNTFFLTTALIAQKILSFGYFWYLSSHLPAQTLGRYVFALSFVTLFGSATDLGLSPLLIREAARTPEEGNAYLRNIFALKIILGFCAISGTLVAIHLTGKPFEVRQLVYVACGLMFVDAFTLSVWGIFKAARNLWYESAVTVLVQCVIIGFGATALLVRAPVVWLMVALFVASLVNFTIAAMLARRKLNYRLLPTWQPTVIWRLVKLVPAFAFAVIFVKIYNVVDSVLLGLLASDEAVAFYAIPAKVITSIQQIIPAALAAVIFPMFTRHYRDGNPRLHRLFEQSCAYLLVLSIPAAVGIAALAPKILQTVWPQYAGAVATFQVMALALPCVFLTFPTGYLLNACDRQAKNTINRGLMTLLMVVGNIVLIPKFSYFGSGLVFLGSNCLLLVLDGYAARTLVRLDFKYLATVLTKVLLSSGGMIVALWLIGGQFGLPLLALIAGGVYLAGIMVQKIWLPPRNTAN